MEMGGGRRQEWVQRMEFNGESEGGWVMVLREEKRFEEGREERGREGRGKGGRMEGGGVFRDTNEGLESTKGRGAGEGRLCAGPSK